MLDKETENKIIDKIKSTDGVKSSTVAFSLKLEKQLKEIRDFLNSRIDLWHDKINDLWYWRERQKEKKAQFIAEQCDTINGHSVLRTDYVASSPSIAGALILGRNTNGWTKWKDANGKTLSEVYRKK